MIRQTVLHDWITAISTAWGSPYDVTRDGEPFLVITPVQGGMPSLTSTLNEPFVLEQ